MVVGNILLLIFINLLCLLRNGYLASSRIRRLGFAKQRVGRSQMELTQVDGATFAYHDVAVCHQFLGTHLIVDRRQHS